MTQNERLHRRHTREVVRVGCSYREGAATAFQCAPRAQERHEENIVLVHARTHPGARLVGCACMRACARTDPETT